jgi:hypothetical protein
MAGARVTAALVLLALGVACGAAPSAQPAATQANANVSGVLDRGPSPTCPADEPCDPPMRATVLIFSGAGGGGARVTLADDGSFAVRLDPGDYFITTAPPAFQGKVEPASVHVPDTGTVYIRLRIVRSS